MACRKVGAPLLWPQSEAKLGLCGDSKLHCLSNFTAGILLHIPIVLCGIVHFGPKSVFTSAFTLQCLHYILFAYYSAVIVQRCTRKY